MWVTRQEISLKNTKDLCECTRFKCLCHYIVSFVEVCINCITEYIATRYIMLMLYFVGGSTTNNFNAERTRRG